MTAQPTHDRLDRQPTWTIQGVFDPDTTGQDFSYTIGLHDLGLPELHLWASPTDGHDPGEDWAFSHRDRAHILNELAAASVDGRLAVGSTVIKRYDHGHVTVTFRVQPPGDRDTLEALGIDPDAQVLPVTWSLDRPPVGPLAELSPQELVAALREYGVMRRSLPTHRGAPAGWELGPASFAADQQFGSRTPHVLTRAAQLWTSRSLGTWVSTSLLFGVERHLTWPGVVARTVARPHGRSAAVRRVEELVPGLIDHVVSHRADEWEEAVSTAASKFGLEAHDDLSALRLNARDWLMEATRSVLTVEVVADIIDADVLLAARGPWLAALRPGHAMPGVEWSASRGVVRAVKGRLRPLDALTWAQIAEAHDRARNLTSAEGSYNEICWRLYFKYFTAASGIPWSKLRDLPAAREVTGGLPAAVEWTSMVQWASCLATLVTFRAEFTAQEVATFVEPVRHLVPDLERTVNKVL